MSRTKRKMMILAGFFLAFVPSSSFAWGGIGHRTIAIIAQAELAPDADVEVSRLLSLEGSKDLASIASWADRIRPEPIENPPMHTVRIPLAAAGYDPLRDCAKQNCIVMEIRNNFLILSDHARDDQQRLNALKYLVHFVGDLHQPLHATSEVGHVKVIFLGKQTNLHRVWDGGIINAFHASPSILASRLMQLPPLETGRLNAESAESWANESHNIAVKKIYIGQLAPLLRAEHIAEPLILPDEYSESVKSIIEDRLLVAGIRLGSLINESLKK